MLRKESTAHKVIIEPGGPKDPAAVCNCMRPSVTIVVFVTAYIFAKSVLPFLGQHLISLFNEFNPPWSFAFGVVPNLAFLIFLYSGSYRQFIPQQWRWLLAGVGGVVIALCFGTSESEPFRRALYYPLLFSPISLAGLAHYFTSWLQSKESDGRPIPQSQPDSGGSFDTDEPIISIKQDLLHRGEFVRAVANEIESVELHKPFFFSITGNWGDGKTSVANLLQEELSKKESIVTVRFVPLHCEAQDYDLKFFETLERQLATKSQGFSFGWRGPLGNFLQSWGFSELTLGFLKFSLPPGRSRSELRKDASKKIRRNERRVVVIIDELDRLDASQISSFFSFLHDKLSLSNCCFVLLYCEAELEEQIGIWRTAYNVSFRGSETPDLAAVSQLHRALGATFLSKLVWRKEALPPIPEALLGSFLFYTDGLDKIHEDIRAGDIRTKEQLEAHRVSIIDALMLGLVLQEQLPLNEKEIIDKCSGKVYLTAASLFTNLRMAKQFAWLLEAQVNQLFKLVNIYDYVLLKLIQFVSTELYLDIYHNSHFYFRYAKLDNPRQISDSAFMKPSAQESYLEEKLKELSISDNKKKALRYFLDMLKEDEPDFAKTAYSKLRRLRESNYFKQYFQCDYSLTKLGSYVVQTTYLPRWKNMDSSGLDDELLSLNAQGLLLNLFEIIENELVQQIDGDTWSKLALSVCRISRELKEEDSFGLSFQSSILYHLLRTTTKCARLEVVPEFLSHLLKSFSSLHWQVSFVQTLIDIYPLKDYKYKDILTPASIRHIFFEPTNTKLKSTLENYNLLTECDYRNDHLARVMYRWITQWETDDVFSRSERKIQVTQMVFSEPRLAENIVLAMAKRRGDDEQRLYDVEAINGFAKVFCLAPFIEMAKQDGSSPLIAQFLEQAVGFQKEKEKVAENYLKENWTSFRREARSSCQVCEGPCPHIEERTYLPFIVIAVKMAQDATEMERERLTEFVEAAEALAVFEKGPKSE